jgi:hypothetical protein
LLDTINTLALSAEVEKEEKMIDEERYNVI